MESEHASSKSSILYVGSSPWHLESKDDWQLQNCLLNEYAAVPDKHIETD